MQSAHDAEVTSPESRAVRFDRAGVRFGGVRAVEDVTFDVAVGDFVAVIGQNGAGKTTILNVLSGLVPLSDGDAFIQGRSVRRLQPLEIARGGVGRSFQDPKLLGDRTVLENLLLGVHQQLRYGLPSQLFLPRRARRAEAEGQRLALRALAEADLEHLRHERAKELPYGLRKIIDLLRSLLGEPSLLLLDEPSSGLDTAEQRIVRDLVNRVRETRTVTAIIVEHHFDVVRAVADRVLAMSKGSLWMEGTPSEVLDSAVFRSGILGKSDVMAEGA